MHHGGTLLLDEIGEMPLGLQVKALRFLQDGQVERVGGRETDSWGYGAFWPRPTMDLKAAIEQGRFRTDLYYRLGVIEISVPRCGNGAEDAVMLAQAFILRYRETLKRG